MSSKTLLAFTVGTAGAFILGYCIYFDQQRRSDPDYRKKVHHRRQCKQKELKYQTSSEELDASPDLNDSETMQRFLNEIKLGEQLISQGNMADGICHLGNAIMMCDQPMKMLCTLRTSLPKDVLESLILKLGETQNMSSNTASSSTKEKSTSSRDFSWPK
ncbi:GH17969 [Drosophila grimshawi]|uniref:GH17969 n=1 Tax=Drosophila grimshawi TaxID=7222 RepID=B4JXJ9_DROGR|nr:GH17969 [Drosophila grimshawi]